jgi:hypothetical protein
MLKNVKHETLAQLLAAGKTQIEAYREAGYTGKSTGVEVRLANHPDVLVRKEELINQRYENERAANKVAVEAAGMGKVWITTRLKYTIDRAIRGTKPVYSNGVVTGWVPTASDNTAAISGLKLAAQMEGLLIERVEMGGPGEFARMTDEELERELVLIGSNIGIDKKALQKVVSGRSE